MACRIGLFVALLVAALEARDGDTVVTNMTNVTNVTNVTMTNIACPNGSFPDYGENATSPEGLDLCVRVNSMVWLALGLFMSLPMTGFSFIYYKHVPHRDRATKAWATKDVWAMMTEVPRLAVAAGEFVFAMYDFMLLAGFQRDYNLGLAVLTALCLSLALPMYCMYWEMVLQCMGKRDSRPVGRSVPTQPWDERVTEVSNIYSDLSIPLPRVLAVAAAQVMLLCFYAYALATNGRPDFTKPDTYLFYFAGTLVQIVLCGRLKASEASKRFEASKRVYVMAKAALSEDMPLYVEENDNVFRIAPWEINIRQALDFLINIAGGGVILLALPLQLAGTSENYFDFLLNSCATIFILDLDDKEGTTFKLGAGPIIQEVHYAIDEASDEVVEVRDSGFFARATFGGERAGQVFTNGYWGVGYYPDTCAEDEEDDTPPTIQLTKVTMDITSRGEVRVSVSAAERRLREMLRINISAA
eukprot:scaffold33325_cov65-Phaeocystis_antarctica.AAC.1